MWISDQERNNTYSPLCPKERIVFQDVCVTLYKEEKTKMQFTIFWNSSDLKLI